MSCRVLYSHHDSRTTSSHALPPAPPLARRYDYKYVGKDARCKVGNYSKYVKLDSYHSVGKLNETAMKSYVASTGPLSVRATVYHHHHHHHMPRVSTTVCTTPHDTAGLARLTLARQLGTRSICSSDKCTLA